MGEVTWAGSSRIVETSVDLSLIGLASPDELKIGFYNWDNNDSIPSIESGLLTANMAITGDKPAVEPIEGYIRVDGDVTDWENINPIAIVDGTSDSLSAVQDSSKLYINVQGNELEDNAIFINSDNDVVTGLRFNGWHGIDYYIDQTNNLYRHIGTPYAWEWEYIGNIAIIRGNGVVEASVKLSQIGLSEPGDVN